MDPAAPQHPFVEFRNVTFGYGARAILDDWELSLRRFVKIMPRDYARALKQLEAERLAAASVAAE